MLGADQLTKWVALGNMRFGESIELLPFFAWTLACNTGAAFSMFQGYGWVFGVVAVVVSAYLIYEIIRLPAGALLEGTAYGLILAGALGNLADRLIRGCVVDFIHVRYGWFDFPVFNVADSAITVGAITWILAMLLEMRSQKAEPSRGE